MSSMIFFRAIKRLYTVNVSSRQVMLSGNVLMLIASLTRCMILCRRIWMVQNSWNIGYRRRWMPAFLTFSSMKTRIPSFSSSTSSSMKMLTVWSSYSLYYSYYIYIYVSFQIFPHTCMLLPSGLHTQWDRSHTSDGDSRSRVPRTDGAAAQHGGWHQHEGVQWMVRHIWCCKTDMYDKCMYSGVPKTTFPFIHLYFVYDKLQRSIKSYYSLSITVSAFVCQFYLHCPYKFTGFVKFKHKILSVWVIED